jgi:hypothetical protein
MHPLPASPPSLKILRGSFLYLGFDLRCSGMKVYSFANRKDDIYEDQREGAENDRGL